MLLASTSVNAFYAIGSCPNKKSYIYNAFGTSGSIEDGTYYSNMGDD
jgi:hypothetical protein